MGPFGVRSNVVAPGMIGGTEGGESNVFGSYEATHSRRGPQLTRTPPPRPQLIA